MTYVTQEVQLAANEVTALPSASVGVGNALGYNLLFNLPIKELQLEWDITTSTSFAGQVYLSFPDFADATYVATPIASVGTGQAFVQLEGSGLGSDVAILIKCINTDGSNAIERARRSNELTT